MVNEFIVAPNFGSDTMSDRHRQEAEACDQYGQQNGTELAARTLAHCVFERKTERRPFT